MFAVRGLAVSFSIFVLLYVTLSLVVCGVWRSMWRVIQQYSARDCADLLLALRVIPFAVAMGVTLTLAVPSFLLLEPRAVAEPMGAVPMALGFCGLAVMLTGVGKAAAALVRVSRTVALWSSGALLIGSRPINSTGSVSVLRISGATPPLTAAGILRPSVWFSQTAEFLLTEREMETALRHEVVHVYRRDNLRKLVLRLVAFPGMTELESLWREATEMAADDAAVSSASEALDLAAAVIKLSRLTPLEPPAELTTALGRSPAESVNARVARLIAWTEPRQSVAPEYSWGYVLCIAATMVTALAVTYSQLLLGMHDATEWLVR